MTKTYCDGCGKETDRNYTDEYLRRELKLSGISYDIRVEVRQDGRLHSGDLCLECVLKVVNEGKEV